MYEYMTPDTLASIVAAYEIAYPDGPEDGPEDCPVETVTAIMALDMLEALVGEERAIILVEMMME